MRRLLVPFLLAALGAPVSAQDLAKGQFPDGSRVPVSTRTASLDSA